MSTSPSQIIQPAVTLLRAAPAPTPATVLLVEDDRAVRRYLEVTLQRAGYRVMTAADGLEAMKVLLSSEVDAVVTDAVMPHVTGYELCCFMQSHPKLSALPIVLLSGADQLAAACEGRESADAYLQKPVRTEELTSCIAHLLATAD